jgi:hypothetical protein
MAVTQDRPIDEEDQTGIYTPDNGDASVNTYPSDHIQAENDIAPLSDVGDLDPDTVHEADETGQHGTSDRPGLQKPHAYNG